MNLKLRKISSMALVAVLSISTLAGCTNKVEDKEVSKDSIVYGISTSPSGVFNPLLTDSIYDDAVCKMLYTSLLKLDEEQKVHPYLAEKYEVSNDQKTITFTINKEAKWSDGKPLTAKDVVFTFTALANKDYDGEYSDYVTNIVGVDEFREGKEKTVKGIEAVDDNTVKISYTEPYGPALAKLGTMGIIPEHIWSEVELTKWKESNDLMNKPIGSGPYKLTSFTEGQDAQFEKNENFLGGKVNTSKIVLKVVSEDTVAADLKNGDVDIADVTNLKKEDIEDIEKNGNKIYRHPNNLFQYMGMNFRNDIFKDVKVRQAIVTAIDRNSMVEKLIEGNGEVKDAPMLSSSWAYPNDANFNKYEYSVENAKKLLNEAGYTLQGDVMVGKDGKKLEFKLDVPTGNSVREQAAQVIQENLSKVGIKVELNKMEFPALMEKVVANHDFDMYMMGNNLTLDPDMTPYWSASAISDEKGKMGWNIVGFTSPELESILKEGTETTDIEKRKEAYKKFAEYMNEQVPWAYLFEQEIVIATNPKLEGFNPSVFRDFDDAQNWKIQE